MSWKALAVFAALLFAIALVNTPHAEACDTGGQAGTPTFSIVQPQVQAYVAPQAFVTQQFVAQPQYVQQQAVVQQFVAQPVVQHQAFAAVNVGHVQAVAVLDPEKLSDDRRTKQQSLVAGLTKLITMADNLRKEHRVLTSRTRPMPRVIG